MQTYSFRAECMADVKLFQEQCIKSGLAVDLAIEHDDVLPDVEVEFSAEASLLTVQDLMRGVRDSHVMLQTLQACPLAQNPLERNFSIH